jgi:SAM-dependent methyltransferase
VSAAAVAVYGRGLAEAAVGSRRSGCRAVADDGTRRGLPLRRWLAPSPAEELELLMRASPAVLDVGCGPGRHLASLARLGIPALGVDIAPYAVALARARGCHVLRQSVFEPLPEAGRWGTALLLDGNVGIDGDPIGLLRHLAGVLRPGGAVLIEFESPDTASREVRLRIETRHEVSDWFPWAWVSVDDAEELACAAGLQTADVWSARGRWFAQLDVPG